jgi:poly-gamma-glutamate capsule biosynthesis protein CapA/YwtB (metallophosphatase superfamily)
MKKYLFPSFITLLMALLMMSTGCYIDLGKAAAGLAAGTSTSGTGTGSTTDPGVSDPTGTIAADTLRLVFAGDIMMARKVQTMVETSGANNYQYCFQNVASYLSTADLAFANLESVITPTGIPDVSQSLEGVAFRAVPAAINGLIYAGIDAVSVANNHAFDYGRSGFEDSLARLKAAGITAVGGGTFADAYTAKVFDVKGTKVAILAFSLIGTEKSMRAQQNDSTQGLTAQTGIAWFYSKYVNPAIVAAKKTADIVVVSIHFGTEYATLPNADQDRYAHQCIDQGAHLVIGHHPHVTQPVMAYAKGYIANSLGNLVFDQSDAATKKGLMLEVLVQNKKIIKVNRKYVQINNNYQPVIQ